MNYVAVVCYRIALLKAIPLTPWLLQKLLEQPIHVDLLLFNTDRQMDSLMEPFIFESFIFAGHSGSSCTRRSTAGDKFRASSICSDLRDENLKGFESPHF